MASIFRRRDIERRAITNVPWNTGQDTFYGASASETKSLGVAAVYASNRILSDSVSTLPLKYYRNIGDERVPMSSTPALFANLAFEGRLISWLTQAMSSLVLRGNAVGLYTSFDGFGLPTAITWLSMDDIWVDDENGGIWYWKGRRIDRRDLLHIPWITVPGKTLALSPIEHYAATTGAALSAQQFGLKWMLNGGVPPGTFKNSAATITADEAETIGQRLVKAIRKGRPLVYGNDWEFTAIQIPPEQAQFIESQKLTATMIAAIYGIPPEKIGGESGSSMTYANVEQQALDFVTFTLGPWLVRLEHAFTSILPERQYVKFNANALVRADIKTRLESYKISREIGLNNINELRKLEDQPPIPGGNDYTPLATKAAASPLNNPTTQPGNENQDDAPADRSARLISIRKELQ